MPRLQWGASSDRRDDQRDARLGACLAAHHPHSSTPTTFGRRYRRFDQRPLAVAQITRVAQAVAVGRTAMFRLPHPAPLSRDSGAREGITTDPSDSTTLWIGSQQ